MLENAREAALEEGKALALAETGREFTAQGAKIALALSEKDKTLLLKVVGYRKRGLFTAEIAKLMDTHEIKVGILTTTARRMGLLPENTGKRRGNPALGLHRAKAALDGGRATAAKAAKEARHA